MTYVTVSGDTFDFVAFKTLGSCKYTAELINANRTYLKTFIFRAGVELEIPEITQENKSVELPPWRR